MKLLMHFMNTCIYNWFDQFIVTKKLVFRCLGTVQETPKQHLHNIVCEHQGNIY